MRRLSLTIALTVIVAMTIWEVYAFLVTNEGIRYFLSEPRRLVMVLLLGLAGGAVALGISRLSPSRQRILKLAALGTFGTVVLIGIAFLGYSLVHFAPLLSEAGSWGLIAAAFVAFLVMAALIWCEFRHVWRRS